MVSHPGHKSGYLIKDYIRFYNQDRLQAKFNGLSPIEYRTKAIA
ncbi:IS3 family transposase [Neobacillus niacini]